MKKVLLKYITSTRLPGYQPRAEYEAQRHALRTSKRSSILGIDVVHTDSEACVLVKYFRSSTLGPILEGRNLFKGASMNYSINAQSARAKADY